VRKTDKMTDFYVNLSVTKRGPALIASPPFSAFGRLALIRSVDDAAAVTATTLVRVRVNVRVSVRVRVIVPVPVNVPLGSRNLRLGLVNCVCFMVLDYLSTTLQRYKKSANYPNISATFFKENIYLGASVITHLYLSPVIDDA